MGANPALRHLIREEVRQVEDMEGLKARELQELQAQGLLEQELRERRDDLEELVWFLTVAESRLQLYRDTFPSEAYEQDLAEAFRRELVRLRDRTAQYAERPDLCRMPAYLALKYRLRTLYKQLGAVLEGSVWQAPAEECGDRARAGVAGAAYAVQAAQTGPAASPAAAPAEVGYNQREHGTYMRSYGSEYVKSYEAAMVRAFYPMSASCADRSIRFLTSSGMSALALALAAYRKAAAAAEAAAGSPSPPCYVQRGFYGEGAELAKLLLPGARRAGAEELALPAERIHALAEQGAPIGCLLVEPGVTWPPEPPIDLERLMTALERHRQDAPLYVIVDRTLTGLANPLFERYGERLPPHVVLIAVESGLKYHEYGLDLMSAGYLVAAGEALSDPQAAAGWVELLALLNAGADPAMVRQLPVPDGERVRTRLQRLNRNARLVEAMLRELQAQGAIVRYGTSVRPDSGYRLEGEPWIGSVFYIELREGLPEAAYRAWIDRLLAEAPETLQLTAGGSFGFDSFRFNTVVDGTGKRNALRLSVGRDPILQLQDKLEVLRRSLLEFQP